MQPAALPTEQALADRLADQRVAERELVLAGLGQHPSPDQLPQRVDELVLGHRRDRREQVEGHPVAEHGGGFDETLMGRLQVLDLAA